MSDIGKSIVKNVGGREVICRELTVSTARKMFMDEAAEDLVSEGLFKDVRLSDLVYLTNLTRDDIDLMYPSDLAVVVEGCRAVNPDFFGLIGRLSTLRDPR